MAGALVDLAERNRPVPPAAGDGVDARRRPATLDLGHGGRALRHRALDARHHWRSDLGTELIVALKPTQTVSLSGYDFTFEGLAQRTGPNYNACSRSSPCAAAARWSASWSRQAQLQRTRDDHQRGGAADARRQPALSVARRCQ